MHGEQVLIIDGMTYVQQSKVYNKTFAQCYGLAEQNTCSWKKASCIDVVFDDYRSVSIKNVELDRRSSGDQLLLKNIVSSALIKQWPLFLYCNDNKNALIAFFISEWKEETHHSLIENKRT